MFSTTDTHGGLLISRMFSAMRERVFRAWTDTRELHRWWHAGDWFAPSVTEADVRVGGHFRLGMISPVSGQEVSTGEFREITPPEKLIMTWRCSVDPDHHEMLVTVEFFDHGKNTELVLSHEGFLTPEECEMYRRNWNAMFSELATLLHDIESPPIELCITIDAPEERVFHALTDANQLMQWFPTMVENEPVPGGKFTFTMEFPLDPKQNYTCRGEYTEVIPHKSVAHTWDVRPKRETEGSQASVKEAKPTVVEFRLTTETDGGTRLMLIHSGWESGPEWDELRETHLRAWTFFLTNLKSYLETGIDDRAKELGMLCAELVQGIRY